MIDKQYNVINILPRTFCDLPVRNGDLIAILNVFCWLRLKYNDSSIKFWMHPDIKLAEEKYHKLFYDYIRSNTDFFSDVEGEAFLPYENIMIWDFRDNIGDVVSISNNKPMQDKVVIFPLFDAFYNTMRNWPPYLFQNILDYCNKSYPDHEKIICTNDYNILSKYNIGNFKMSFDFIENVEHIRTSQVYIGGDTGMTHFASSLDRGPSELIYFYSSRGILHSLPFHLMEGHGVLKTYSTYYDMNIF